MNYGLPWQGSKSRIAQWVVSNLPPGDVLIDLFAGGCAVTHRAIESGRWARVVANDICEGPEMFADAVAGEYDGYATVCTREEFAETDDPMAKLLYSFGSDRQGYLWSRDIEPLKVAVSRMLSAPSLHERRMAYRSEFVPALCKVIRKRPVEEIGRSNGPVRELEGLEGLDRVQSLEGLDRHGRLEVSRLDYREVPVPDGAVVYADPPYRNTSGKGRDYGVEFDFDAFDGWLASAPFMVVVSEKTAPPGCTEVASCQRCETMQGGSKWTAERLFVQDAFVDGYRERMQIGKTQPLGTKEGS